MEIVTFDTQILLDAIFKWRKCRDKVLQFLNFTPNLYILNVVYREALNVAQEIFDIGEETLRRLIMNTHEWNELRKTERRNKLTSVESLKNIIKTLQREKGLHGRRSKDVVALVSTVTDELINFSREELLKLIARGGAFKPLADTFVTFLDFFKSRVIYCSPTSTSKEVLPVIESAIKHVFNVSELMGAECRQMMINSGTSPFSSKSILIELYNISTLLLTALVHLLSLTKRSLNEE